MRVPDHGARILVTAQGTQLRLCQTSVGALDIAAVPDAHELHILVDACKLSDGQKLCGAAIPCYAASLKRRDTPATIVSSLDQIQGVRSVSEGQAPARANPTASASFIRGDELVGFAVALRIAERRDPVLINDREHGTGVWTSLAHRPDLVALAPFTDIDRETWSIADEGSEPYAACHNRLNLWLGAEPMPRRIPIEPHRPEVHDLPSIHPDFNSAEPKQAFSCRDSGRRVWTDRG
ncbi:MAG TPA: hypothetical protein VFR21_09405 [Bradyrhizobium sp.]|nr:hypothetical protein [Bradyrhizobium sp.]